MEGAFLGDVVPNDPAFLAVQRVVVDGVPRSCRRGGDREVDVASRARSLARSRCLGPALVEWTAIVDGQLDAAVAVTQPLPFYLLEACLIRRGLRAVHRELRLSSLVFDTGDVVAS